MFNNRKDPLVDSIKQVMQENETRRRVEAELNEELGIASKKALPFELQAEYDSVLAEAIKEALHPNKQVLDVHEPEKDELTKKDFEMLRAGKIDEAGRTLMPGAKPHRSGSFRVAVNKAEAARQRALKRAEGMVKRGASHEVAAKEHGVTVAELKNHMMKEETQLDEAKNPYLTKRHMAANWVEGKIKDLPTEKYKDISIKGSAYDHYSPLADGGHIIGKVGSHHFHLHVRDNGFDNELHSTSPLSTAQKSAIKTYAEKHGLGVNGKLNPAGEESVYSKGLGLKKEEKEYDGRDSVSSSRKPKWVQKKYGGGGSDPSKKVPPAGEESVEQSRRGRGSKYMKEAISVEMPSQRAGRISGAGAVGSAVGSTISAVRPSGPVGPMKAGTPVLRPDSAPYKMSPKTINALNAFQKQYEINRKPVPGDMSGKMPITPGMPITPSVQESKRPSVPSDNIKKGAEAGRKNAGGKTPAWLKKAIEAKKNLKEEQNNPYAIGMAAAMKSTGDKPPLEKSTITKGHEIAKKIAKNEKMTAEEVMAEIRANMGEEAFNAMMEEDGMRFVAPGLRFDKERQSLNYGQGRTWGPVEKPVTGPVSTPQVAQNMANNGAPAAAVDAARKASVGPFPARPAPAISPNKPNLQQRQADIAKMAPAVSGDEKVQQAVQAAATQPKAPVAGLRLPTTAKPATGSSFASGVAQRSGEVRQGQIERGLSDYKAMAQKMGLKPTQANLDYNRQQIDRTLSGKADQFGGKARGRYAYLRTGQGTIKEGEE